MPESPIEHANVEQRAVSLFRTERQEDLWAIALAAVLVGLMVAGVRF